MSSCPSMARVSALLAHLRAEFGGFHVQQTTLGVSTAAYERARAAAEAAEVRVRVRDDRGQELKVEEDLEWVFPGGWVPVTECSDLAGAAVRLVEEATGVRPVVEELERAAIVCVHDQGIPDREPLYRLTALFEASPAAGEPNEDARWERIRAEPTVF